MKQTKKTKLLVNAFLGTVLSFGLYPISAFSDEENSGAKTKIAEKDEVAIRLESVFVGDKEQPAISYFIPWQGIGAPDKLHWNVEDKHDSALSLVDREILLRSINIYEEMNLEQP